MNEDVRLEINDKNGFFYIESNGKKIAKMTFVFSGPNKIIINHTEVNEEYNGKGYGKKMVAKAVEFARNKNIDIVPTCSFVKVLFDKTPEYNDVYSK